MQTLIDESMIDICKEEGVSPEQVVLDFLFYWLYRHRLSKHKLFMSKGELIFSSDQDKKSCSIF